MSYDYPAGAGGTRSTMVELACFNPACEHYADAVECDATTELGATYLRDEDEATCECGWTRTDPTSLRFVQTEDAAGISVVVDIREDEVAFSRAPSGFASMMNRAMA